MSASASMLAIHLKRGEQVDLRGPILSHIRETYSDREADEAVDDLQAVQKLRNDVIQAQTGAQAALKDSLAKYYRCLTAIETRFPISLEKGQIRLNFQWYDAFRPSKKTTQVNVHFEKAAVLFNLAANTSQQGLTADRSTPEGMLNAFKLFQDSAGTFALLKDTEALKVDNPKPVDLSPECCSMLEKLMMAQAQECMFHKAAMDKKSPGTLAKLARQASIMYGEASSLFAAPILSSHFERSWANHTLMKSSLYDVEALVQQGKQMHQDGKIAPEIATLQQAFQRVQATKKLAKAISPEVADSVRSTQDAIQVALKAAERDNGTIYLERVPDFSTLPAIQPVLLFKAQSSLNLDASQENLFAGLIPDTSAKALSKYSDLVDSVCREQLDILAGATDKARLRLKELELPDLLDALDAHQHAAVPDSLLRELEEVQSIGGVSHLHGILGEISELRRSVEADLASAQSALDEEATKDAAARAQYGDRWNVPQSSTLARHLWEKLSSYRATYQQATDSDGKVMQKLADSEPAFERLTPDCAAALMPRLEAPMVSVSVEDPLAVVGSLRRNMMLISDLSSERAGIEEAIKEAKNKDNILPKLMASNSASYDALFASELKKYDTLKADVVRNAAKNEETLAGITRDAQAFATVFEIGAWRASCDAAAASSRADLKSFREVLDHLSEGLRFYMSLQEAVKMQLQQCSDFGFTRQLQRDDLQQDLDRRAREEQDSKTARYMATLSVAPNASPAAPSYPPPPTSTPHQYQQQLQPQPYGQQQQQQPHTLAAPPLGAAQPQPSQPSYYQPPQQPQPQPPAAYAAPHPGQPQGTPAYYQQQQLPPSAYAPPGQYQPPPAGQYQPPQQQQQPYGAQQYHQPQYGQPPPQLPPPYGQPQPQQQYGQPVPQSVQYNLNPYQPPPYPPS